MMGLLPYKEAQKKYYYIVPSEMDLQDCYSAAEELHCSDSVIDQNEFGKVIDFGVKEMVSQFGPREPSYGPETTHLNSPVIVLTEQAPNESERAWYHLLYKWWATSGKQNETLGHSYGSVTRNLGTISTGIPK
jgi:hypothetical protein